MEGEKGREGKRGGGGKRFPRTIVYPPILQAGEERGAGDDEQGGLYIPVMDRL